MAGVQIRLLLFAVLRDIVGRSELELTLAEGTTAAQVWNQVRAPHPELRGYDLPPMTAVNQAYVPPQTILRHGDEVAFIPPVAGG